MANKKREDLRIERDEMRKKAEEVIQAKHGIAKTAALLEGGVSYKSILAMVEKGDLIRVKSGYYSMPDTQFSEEELITAQYPDGVLTMETALFYHGYIEERPALWSIAVSKNISKSRFKVDYPKIRPYFTEDNTLSMGVETIEVAGTPISIYTVDRLICDILKYREKVDVDIYRRAIEKYIADEKKDTEHLMEYAASRRVVAKVQNILGTWMVLPEVKRVEPKEIIWVEPAEKEEERSFEKIIEDKQDDIKEEKPKVLSAEPADIAKAIFTILQHMELIEDMSIFVELYNLLCVSTVDGIAVSRRLIEYCEEGDFPLDENRIRKMHNWGKNRFMEQKWSRFTKRQKNVSSTWNEVAQKLSDFVVPIGLAMCKGTPFTGDWMPEPGRFFE